MRSAALILVGYVLCTTLASARLGETEQELTARFGSPSVRASERVVAQGKLHEIGTRLVFRQGDWHIESVMIDGRSSRESYTKVGDWTEDQIATVLNSNAQGGKWADTSKDSMKKVHREWRRNDGATAVWQIRSITLTHPAYGRAKTVAEAKAKANAARTPKL
jgi:hypothetical protein